jgi:hypothetical protein
MTKRAAGWMVRGVSKGISPDTRPIIEIYAVNISDAVEAVAAVEEHAGIFEPPAETLCSLPRELLDRLGLKEPGQIGLVRCEF